jgi:ABC-type transporter Mla subunit MlaD
MSVTTSIPPTVRAARRRRQTAGALILLAIVGLFTIAITRWNPFSSDAIVHAEFADAIGTTPGGALTEVRLDGVEVGTVTKIVRDGDHALFTLSISPSAAHELHADATAELRPRTPFEGTAFVDLTPGHAAGPLTSTIPLARTRDYVGLYSALQFATAPTRSSLQSDLAGLSATLGPAAQTGLRGALNTLPALVRHLGPAATAFAGPHDTELLGTIRGASRTFAALSAEESTIPGFIADSATSFSAFNVDAGRPLGAALQSLPGTLAALRPGQAALNAILNATDPLTGELRPGLRQVPGTLSAIDPLLRTGKPALTQATPLLANLRSTLGTVARATPATHTVLSDLGSTVKVLGGSLLPALNRQTPIGVPAYLALINALQGGDGAFENFQTPAQGRAPGAIGAGHFVNFQGRFYTGYATPSLPACSLFATLSPVIGSDFQKYGLCTP